MQGGSWVHSCRRHASSKPHESTDNAPRVIPDLTTLRSHSAREARGHGESPEGSQAMNLRDELPLEAISILETYLVEIEVDAASSSS